jgi:hypothetical protein
MRPRDLARQHSIHLELRHSAPTEVLVGMPLVIEVSAQCTEGCDLTEVPIALLEFEYVAAATLLEPDETASAFVATLTSAAPRAAGEHTWILRVPSFERGEIAHAASSRPLIFRTLPHATSMAVWDVPSSVEVGTTFSMRAGLRCECGCALGGSLVRLVDERGAELGCERLGETPWPGTTALYVATLSVNASEYEGTFRGLVTFEDGTVDLPHERSVSPFTYVAVNRPEHRFRVRVVDAMSGLGIENVQVRLGAHRASTDSDGCAILTVGAGAYDLSLWKPNYRPFRQAMAVSGSMEIQLHVTHAPDRHSEEDRAWM